jgi:translation initiation factor 1 (eIF-1/SUI1)
MTDFFDKNNEIENNLNLDIHIFVQQRGTKKSDTIIKGLFFPSKDESKLFLSTIKKKFGVNGSIKKMEDIDPVNDVFQFTGDHGIKIKDVLIKDYSKKEENFKLHGNK